MEEEIGKTAGAIWQALRAEKRSFRIRTQKRRALY
jgi:hypothetical protein